MPGTEASKLDAPRDTFFSAQDLTPTALNEGPAVMLKTAPLHLTIALRRERRRYDHLDEVDNTLRRKPKLVGERRKCVGVSGAVTEAISQLLREAELPQGRIRLSFCHRNRRVLQLRVQTPIRERVVVRRLFGIIKPREQPRLGVPACCLIEVHRLRVRVHVALRWADLIKPPLVVLRRPRVTRGTQLKECSFDE